MTRLGHETWLEGNEASDPIFSREALVFVKSTYIPDTPAGHAEVSPPLSDWQGSPPLLVQASRSEMLRDDCAEAFVERRQCRGRQERVERRTERRVLVTVQAIGHVQMDRDGAAEAGVVERRGAHVGVAQQHVFAAYGTDDRMPGPQRVGQFAQVATGRRDVDGKMIALGVLARRGGGTQPGARPLKFMPRTYGPGSRSPQRFMRR
ncbi:MAG: hypothetical protein U5L05_03455 [Rubrivivax sp.]|nr:hypothetical protein [Rubrivivax sp.]